MENWKPVVGFEGFYEVSDKGNVKSLDYKPQIRKYGSKPVVKLLKPYVSKKGYPYVYLSKRDGTKNKLHYVHRLVAIAFIKNPESKREVNHIDGNKENNCVENLSWATPAENMKHSYDTGLLCLDNTHRANCKPVICLDTGEQFRSIREAKEKTGFNEHYIGRSARGECRTTYGYRFSFIEEYDGACTCQPSKTYERKRAQNPRYRRVICIDTNKIYESEKHASEELGIAQGYLNKSLRAGKTNIKGYNLMHYKDECELK